MTSSERILVGAIVVAVAIGLAIMGVVLFRPERDSGPVRAAPRTEPEPTTLTRPAVQEPSANETPAPPEPSASPEADWPPSRVPGRIVGTVRLTHEVEPVWLEVTKDHRTCGQQKLSPRLKVGPGGGLANAVVYLEDVETVYLEDVENAPSIDLLPAGSLDQFGCEYVPHVQIHPWTREFAIKSSDPILHNVHMNFRDDDSTAINLPFPSPTTETRKFKRPGLLYAKCDAGHVWMSAYVFAVDHPYYSLTAGDGRFRLEHVPPGKVTIVMWHEGFRLVDTPRDAQGHPTGYVWSPDVFQKRTIELKSGETLELDFDVSQ